MALISLVLKTVKESVSNREEKMAQKCKNNGWQENGKFKCHKNSKLNTRNGW